MLDTWAETHQETIQHAQFIGVGLGNTCKAFRMLVMQCRCYQHYLRPQTLPSARILSVLLGYIEHLRHQQPPKSQHYQHQGACLDLNSLLHTRFQHPSKTLGTLRCPKVKRRPKCADDDGPKTNCPKPSAAEAEASKTRPKITLIFDPCNPFPSRHAL